jgi:hypothetical protein
MPSLITDLISSSDIIDMYIDPDYTRPAIVFKFNFSDNNLRLFENVIAIIDRHEEERTIFWRDVPIANSEITFVVPGLSYLPITRVIYPNALFNLLNDYYLGFIKNEPEALARILEALERENEFSKNSSMNYGLEALSINALNQGFVKMKFYFNGLTYFQMGDWMYEDARNNEPIEDLNIDLVHNRELADIIDNDNYLNNVFEEEEQLVNQMNLLFAAHQDLSDDDLDFEFFNEILARDNANEILRIDSEIRDLELSNEFDRLERDNLFLHPSGSGINKRTKKSKLNHKIYSKFKDNLEDLVVYYPIDSEIENLVRIKNNLSNFFRRNKNKYF